MFVLSAFHFQQTWIPKKYSLALCCLKPFKSALESPLSKGMYAVEKPPIL